MSTEEMQRVTPGSGAYQEFRAEILRRSTTTIAETSQTYQSAAELAAEIEGGELGLQSRWFAGEFGRNFHGVDDQVIEVIQFGHWNHAAGPDFTEAVVSIDGEHRKGSIEIDIDARGWERHGHSHSAAYDNTVLHLFCTAAGQGRFFTKTSTNRAVPQVQLQGWEQADTPPPLFIPEAKIGRCAHPLKVMPQENVHSLLVAAAQFRLDQKALRLRRTESVHGWEETLYQGVAEALGYRKNRLPMRVLAQRFPLQFLRKNKAQTEPLLFGAAGFLEEPVYESAASDTRDYLRSLWETWWKSRSAYFSENKKAPQWVFAGSRPSNHPQRRVAALAALVTDWSTFATIVRGDQPTEGKQMRAFFQSLQHPYWDAHFTLTSQRTERPVALVGAVRSAEILINWVLPLQHARGLDVWDTYRGLPVSVENAKSRRAALRLFGDRSDLRDLTRHAYQQQALLQIYDDFCMRDASDCEACPFPEQLSQWSHPTFD